jgi:hypothetical protein
MNEMLEVGVIRVRHIASTAVLLFFLALLGACSISPKNGVGALTYSNGDHYEGQLLDGKPNGRGKAIYGKSSKFAGDRYDGEWRDGNPYGRGVYIRANGDRYEGDIADGQPNGQGIATYGKASTWAGGRYEGGWRDGKLNGQGCYTTSGDTTADLACRITHIPKTVFSWSSAL